MHTMLPEMSHSLKLSENLACHQGLEKFRPFRGKVTKLEKCCQLDRERSFPVDLRLNSTGKDLSSST